MHPQHFCLLLPQLLSHFVLFCETGYFVNSDVSPASASCTARIRGIQKHCYTSEFTTSPCVWVYVGVHVNYRYIFTKLLNICVDSFYVHVILLIWNTYVKWNIGIKGNILNFDRHCFISPLKDFDQHYVENVFPTYLLKSLGWSHFLTFLIVLGNEEISVH